MLAALRRFFASFRSVLCFSAPLLFCMGCVMAATAQTVKHQVLTSALEDTYNGPAVHASDGNYYAFTSIIAYGYTPLTEECPVSSNETDCSYITKIAPDGTTSIFHTFLRTSDPSQVSNVEGIGVSSLIEARDGSLYGTTLEGGTGVGGTIFRITKDGVFTLLHSFDGQGTNGQIAAISPTSLIEGSDGNFYGTVWQGGGLYDFGAGTPWDFGFIFKMTVSGDVTVLYKFSPGDGPIYSLNGGSPMSLVEGADGKFYGTTLQSPYDSSTLADTGQGTIFSFDPSSGTVTTLHNFAYDGSEGTTARMQLVQGPDGALYGATSAYNRPGSISGPANVTAAYNGSLFRITPSGSFSVIHKFTGGADGWNPSSHLIVASDGNLYGTTTYGGINTACTTFPGCGVVFRASLSGTITPYYSFLGGDDSGLPNGGLIQTETGSFFGTTIGDLLNSTVFGPYLLSQTPALSAPIQLSFTKDGMPFDPSTTSVAANTTLVLNWNVLNAYSNTARDCHAVLYGNYSGAGAWAGALYGTVSSSGYGGSVTVTPTSGGTLTYALTCGGVESGYINLNVTGGPLKIVTTSLKDATVGVHYTQTLAATGGVTPYTWAVSGLPDGLTLDPNTGTISGIITKPPTPSTDFDLAITVTDSSSPQQHANATITLNVQNAVTIGAVEFTQSIQVFQPLNELKDSITAHGGPPMPMISGKPAVMRVYLTPVRDVSTVILQVTGSVNATRTWVQQPNCYPEEERSHANSCPSIDLYFTPPSGTWSVDMLLTNVSGDQLQQETFTITSKDTRNIHLLGTAVCDSYTVNFNTGGRNWMCGDPSVLIGKTTLMNMMMPTDHVILDMSTNRITNLAFSSSSLTLAQKKAQYDTWLDTTSFQLGRLYTSRAAVNDALDLVNNTHSLYFGTYRHNLDQDNPSVSYDVGIADHIPGRGAMTADVVRRLNDVDALAEVMTHETGHTLGLEHTNLEVSPVATAYPGCYNSALLDPGGTTDWVPFITNNVQSTNGPEYPFNVTTHTLMDPVSTYELMSYCMPRWISPRRYATVIAALNGGAVAEPFLRSGNVQAESSLSAVAQPQATTTTASYWEVSGTIDGTAVTFAPVFQNSMQGTTDPGTGTWSIVEQDPQGNALYTRYFTPVQSHMENETGDSAHNQSVTYFGESVPVTAGVASIAVKDDSGAVLGRVTLAANAPAVTITSPGTGFTATGVQAIAWTATNPMNGTLTARVLYSPDNGATWSQLMEDQSNALDLDFDSLPGSAGASALIKVLVSDGANTGSATSAAFTVPHKKPTTVIISNPVSGAVVPAADTLQLVGAAYDVDDGMLSGSKLAWSSNLQGDLGTGSPLIVSLAPGIHTLTLTATDSDGNTVSTSTSVTIVGEGPSISLTSDVDSSSKCTTATVNASIGAMGANLSRVQYSIDGGSSYVDINLSSLPYTFNIPGTGDINIVARVYDLSGQFNAQSADVTIASACSQVNLQTPTITWPTPSHISYGTALSDTQLNATASVPGVFSYSPAIGAVLPAGFQTVSATFTPTDTGHYSSATASVTLDVTPALLTITPVSATRAYGFPNPNFTYQAAGFVNGETASVLSGAPAIATTAVVTSPPGSYGITAAAGNLSGSNYSFVFGAGNLTVTQAASSSTIRLSSATIAVGTPETISVTVVPAGAGVPTGTITCMDGSTSLGTQTLSAGAAAFTANGLASGSHTIIVNYSGDTNFAASSATALVVVTAAPSTDFTFTVTGGSKQTIGAGGTATFTFALNPLGSSPYPGDVKFAVTGLPANVTATFSPQVVAANVGKQSVTLTVKYNNTASARIAPYVVPVVVCLMLPFAIRRRRFRIALLGAILACLPLNLLLTGCVDATRGHALTVTATAGTTQHSTVVTLISR